MLPKAVKIVEVGARDGLQNEARMLSVGERVELIRLLGESGLRAIEVGSFTPAKWSPQMVGSGEVLAGVLAGEAGRASGGDGGGVAYPVLVPNMRGLEDALAAGAREVAVFAAASEGFSRANLNCDIETSLARFGEVAGRARGEGVAVRGYVSCVLGCPVEGEVAVEAVVRVCGELVEMGCYEVSLGDTIGVGTPGKVGALIERVGAEVGREKLAVHFHDTYGQALANIYAALQLGIATVDASVAGLGGCPHAPGASGNVATEDVVYMLDGLGIRSGVDMGKLLRAGEYACGKLGRGSGSKVGVALGKKTDC